MNKDKGSDHKEGKSRSERESQSSIVLHLANFLWYILNDVFLTHLTKAPSLMCNLNLCTEMCYHSHKTTFVFSTKLASGSRNSSLMHMLVVCFNSVILCIWNYALGFVLVEKLPVWGAFVH
jgi:hypothetical protein